MSNKDNPNEFEINTLLNFPSAEEVRIAQSERIKTVMKDELYKIREKINVTSDDEQIALPYLLSKATKDFLANRNFTIEVKEDGKKPETVIIWRKE